MLDQELAAQGARKMGLDKEPRVVQAIEAARREVLARSYHDVLAEKTPLPASDDIDRYYDEVTARGAQAIQPPADQVFGMRTFLLTDPNGYTLMFAQGLDELDR